MNEERRPIVFVARGEIGDEEASISKVVVMEKEKVHCVLF